MRVLLAVTVVLGVGAALPRDDHRGRERPPDGVEQGEEPDSGELTRGILGWTGISGGVWLTQRFIRQHVRRRAQRSKAECIEDAVGFLRAKCDRTIPKRR